MKKLKWTSLVFILLCLFFLAILWYADFIVTKRAENRTSYKIDNLPTMNTGLLLGTSKYLKSGYPNLYFSYRIEAATELFKAGKIRNIIISGDNGRSSYDEPTDMKNELIKNGVDSNHIYLDYAGFRTFDSVVRVKEIFGQDSVLFISQKFHNERAVYIADQLGITAYGYNAKDVAKLFGIKTKIREKFARVKVILDFMIGTKPKFLGEKVKIE